MSGGVQLEIVPRQAPALAHVAGQPVLMIGDADGFLEAHGHVRFVPEPARTRLRVSVPNLTLSGLTSRSELLRTAAQ